MLNHLGAWIVAEEPGLPENIVEGFNFALKDLIGAKYKPLLHAAHQLVHGTIHAVVAWGKGVYPDAEPYLVTVYLHEDLPTEGGTFKLMSIRPIALGPFA
jgi:hypothetical protein